MTKLERDLMYAFFEITLDEWQTLQLMNKRKDSPYLVARQGGRCHDLFSVLEKFELLDNYHAWVERTVLKTAEQISITLHQV